MVKRFFWVRSDRSATLHMKDASVSEGKTYCGRWAGPGWHYWLAGGSRALRLQRMRYAVCKGCSGG